MDTEFDLDKRLPAYPEIPGEALNLYFSFLATTGRRRHSALQAGLDPHQVMLLIKKDTALAERQEGATEEYNELIDEEIHRRAITGVKKGVYFKGEKVDTEMQYSDKLLEVMAKANNPGKYKDHITVDANVKAGVLVVNADLNPDDWEATYGKSRIDTSRLGGIGVQPDPSTKCTEG